MKKTLLILALLLTAFTFGQTNGITYQAVIYSATGESVPGIKNNNAPLANKEICLQFSIVDDYSQTEYQEKITISTDEFGMVNLVIGNGTQTGGYANSFQTIVWNAAKKYLKVGLNQKGNSDYFDEISNQVLSYVPFALAANSATSVSGIVDIANGGTNATTITGAKTNLQLQNVDNTRDLDKPIATLTQTALNSKVDKVSGKELSSNDYSTAEKTKLAAISGVNTGDQDLSSYATKTSTTTALALKVDKVSGKELSSNDFSTAEKTKLAAISGVNTGDQDLSSFVTATALTNKVDKVTGKELSTNDYTTAEKTKLAAISGVNTGDQDLSSFVTAIALTNKVDKVAGKELSSNDYTTVEKSKLAAITGNNTGDQDLSLYATTTSVALKANAADVTSGLATKVDKVTGKELSSNDFSTAEKTKLAAISGVNTGDQDLSLLASAASVALKANTADVTTDLSTKVDKVTGKELSSNDYTTDEKAKLAAITGTNTGDQDLSLLASAASVALKANTADVTSELATKVDKVTGKELSSNDYTTDEKTKLAAVSGVNTGDQDLTTLATVDAVALKANASDVNTNLATKVDKVTGKELSSNDYTTIEKTKLAAITGVNTGDQDLSLYATTISVALKANTADVTTNLATKVDKVTGKELSSNDYTTVEKTKLAAITGINTGDQDLSSFATTTDLIAKENSLNKSLDITLSDATNTKFPTELAVKTFVENKLMNTSAVASQIIEGAVWITPTTGTLNGVSFVLSNSQSNATSPWDLSVSEFSAAPLSETQNLTDIAVSDDWTITFASPINDLRLYSKYWRAANYTFDNAFSILSGSGLSSNGNILTVNGWGNGIIQFSSPITSLTVDSSEGSNNQSSQIMTFGGEFTTPLNSGSGEVARLESPIFSGIPTAPTATPGTSTTQIATTAFVNNATTGKFVDITTNQTVAGNKTFSSDIVVNGIKVGNGGGSQSTVIGNSANGTLNDNTALGFMTLDGNSGTNNTAVGTNSMRNSGNTSMNTSVGVNSGTSENSGNGNTYIGHNANVTNNSAISNATAIGADAIVTASNTIQLGADGTNGTSPISNVKTSGTITAGVITYPNTSGTNGQVLTTNGSGVADWSSPASISISSINGNSNFNGAIINNGALSLTPADATNGGIVTIGTQTFSGNKNINGNLTTSSLLTETLDQIFTAQNNISAMPGGGQTNIWQSFTAGRSGLLSKVSMEFYQPTASGTLYIYSGQGIGGSLLTSQSFSISSPNNDSSFIDFALSTPVNVTSGSVYTMSFVCNSGVLNVWFSDGSYGSPLYSSGASYYGNSQGSALNNTSIDFKTYVGSSSGGNIVASGTIKTGALTYPNVDGTSGQVLATNGAGLLGWVTPSTVNTSNFVDLTTDQLISGVKIFSTDALINSLTVGRGLGNNQTNTALGDSALKNNTTGYVNSAFGFNALMRNTTGAQNTAMGVQSLYHNTTGYANTALGSKALSENTTGGGNIALGLETLYANISGNDNVALGNAALHETISGQFNSAYGTNALYKNTTGDNNIAIGANALFEGTTNLNNTAVGTDALKNQNASRNTALGYQAGLGIVSGDNNTVIGASTNVTGGSANATAIGYGAVATSSNTIQLGNSAVTDVKTNGSVTAAGYKLASGTASQFLMADGSVSSTSQLSDLQAQITQLQAQIASLNFANGLFPQVTIGTQVWSTKNLDVTTYRDGSIIPQVTDPTEWSNLTTGAWCYVNNDSSNNQTYGKLYNWYAVHDPRGIAPAGYHVATEADFNLLILATGGQSQSGYALKEVGSTHWSSNYNPGATNSSGFTAVGGGLRESSGNFIQFNRLAVFHLSDTIISNGIFYPHYKVIRADDGEVFMDWLGLSPNNGFSVRLVKN